MDKTPNEHSEQGHDKLNCEKPDCKSLKKDLHQVTDEWLKTLDQLEERQKELELSLHDVQELNDSLMESNAELLELRHFAQESEAAALEADRQKTRYLAKMSHEIRSPLSIIIGYADKLIEEEADIEQFRTLTSHIRSTGGFLLDVVNEILDVSKIEAGGLTLAPEWCELSDILNEIRKLYGEQKNPHVRFEIKLELPLPKRIYVDQLRLKQVLINLCTNAFKFTSVGRVSLLCRWNEPNLSISIADTGIGMNQEQLKRVFMPFCQAEDSTSSRYGGTGLGLFIVKEMIELMGGAINTTSELSKGSEFSFFLPQPPEAVKSLLHKREEVFLPYRLQEAQTFYQFIGKVLVAEDTKDLQIIFGAVLKRFGLEPTFVSNGQEALDEYEKNKYQLIVLDIEMPVMGGVEAVERLRKQEQEESKKMPPIIAFTAHAFKEDQVALVEHGFDCCLTKPLDRIALQEILLQYLPQSKS